VRVLVANAGSSSLKLSLLGDDDSTLGACELDARGDRVDPQRLRAALDGGLADADAVGHRIVHGGTRYRAAVRIDAGVQAALRELADLAPLHQAKSLAALQAVSKALPALPAVACFDTAFHATLPPAASTYALPAEWRTRYGVRRFGFHGLSHAWIARRAPALLGRDARGLRLVSAHLGAGASLCAIEDGRSIDTTMGFTPLDGLVMATRSGSVDPGLLLWLLRRGAVGKSRMERALEHESGLAGLAGSGDMREVLARAELADEQARLALEVYLRSLRGAIAAMAAALGGIDALAFTGGVGANSADVRELALDGLSFLGLELDLSRNREARADADVSSDGAGAAVLVIAAREDLEIARQTREALAADAG
jgi:acetate kinase